MRTVYTFYSHEDARAGFCEADAVDRDFLGRRIIVHSGSPLPTRWHEENRKNDFPHLLSDNHTFDREALVSLLQNSAERHGQKCQMPQPSGAEESSGDWGEECCTLSHTTGAMRILCNDLTSIEGRAVAVTH
jgi:hypothetical protein